MFLWALCILVRVFRMVNVVVGALLVWVGEVVVGFLFRMRRLWRLRDDLPVPVVKGTCCLFGLVVDAIVSQVFWLFCVGGGG